MDVGVIWNLVLTAMVTGLGALFWDKLARINELSKELSSLRENLARDYAPRAEMAGWFTKLEATVERFGSRMDDSVERLENKIDQINRKT